MNKEEKIYRLNKAYNILTSYTTLSDNDRLERSLEEVLKVVTSTIEDNN